MVLTTGRDFAWLKGHTVEDSNKREVSAPFCLKLGSINYAIASNGRYLIAVKLLPDEPAPFPFDPVDKMVTEFLESGGSTPDRWMVTPKELMEWLKCTSCNNVDIVKSCSNCKGKKTQICKDCGGSGDESCTCKCGDKHSTQCSNCEGKKLETCETCNGRGTIGCCCLSEVDPGSVNYDIKLDRRFFRKAFADLPIVWGKRISVSLRGPTNYVRLDTDAWSFVIMPINDAISKANLSLEKVELLDAMAQL
jgi:hypothetical protein